jgi:hypothetical protein
MEALSSVEMLVSTYKTKIRIFTTMKTSKLTYDKDNFYHAI